MEKDTIKEQKLDNIPKKNEKKVKKSSQMSPKVKSFLYIGCVVVAILLLALGISFYQNSLRLNNYQNVLEGVYRSSYFNMVDKVNTVSIETDKLVTAQDKSAQISTLRNISKNCDAIVASLSLLSIDSENVVELTKFFNQLGGLSDAYTDKLFLGEELTDADYEQIGKITKSLNNLKGKLNPHNEGITTGEYAFVSESIMKDNKSAFASSLGDMTADSMDYPAMIFDGPFSSALESKDIKGLPDNEISKDQALSIVKDKIFKGRAVKVLSTTETNADLDSYDFRVSVLDKKYFAQISKRGGLLLTLSGEVVSAQPKIDEEEAESIAEEFATRLGFEKMTTVWSETNDNISYINLAPQIDGCIMYPDLVKAKVCLTTKMVVGWEAQNYAFNHIDRDTSTNIAEDEARQNLATNELVLSSNLCVIPTDDGKEDLCYEFVVERDDGVYYIYVSAVDGSTDKIMKEITNDDVHKLL